MVLNTDTFDIQTFAQVASIIRYITKYFNAIRSFALTFVHCFWVKKGQKKRLTFLTVFNNICYVNSLFRLCRKKKI
jgi:hypothetical protein